MSPPDFPAGSYSPEPNINRVRRDELIAEIEQLPRRIRDLVAGLSEAELDTPYKKWTVRQIVHHLADSHTNAYVRFRLTLTESQPTIKPYDETRWGELPDAKSADVAFSAGLLEGLHARWTLLLRSMTDADFDRQYFHPEYQKTVSLTEALGLYAHHCRHHAEQIAWQRSNR